MRVLISAATMFLAVLTGTAGNAAAGNLLIADGTGGLNLNALAFAAAAVSGNGEEISIRKMETAAALQALRDGSAAAAVVARKDIPRNFPRTAITPYAKAALYFYVDMNNRTKSLTLAELQKLWTASRPVWQHNGFDIQRVAPREVFLERRFFHPAPEIYRPAVPGSHIHNAATLFCAVSNKFLSGSCAFLAVNGITPLPANIQNGTYPLTVDFVIVTLDKPAAQTAKLLAALRHHKVRLLLYAADLLPPELPEKK